MTQNAIGTPNPIDVPHGGLGVSSLTAYTPICGGTTSTGATQSISSLGSSGALFTSNGTGSLPSFQAASITGSALVPLSTQSGAFGTNTYLDFTSQISSTYAVYFLDIRSKSLVEIYLSTDGGSNWLNSGYAGGNLYIPQGSNSWNVASSLLYWPIINFSSPNAINTSQIWLFGLNSSVHPAYISYSGVDNTAVNSNCYGVIGSGIHTTTSGVNAIRVYLGYGGTVTLYGLKTS